MSLTDKLYGRVFRLGRSQGSSCLEVTIRVAEGAPLPELNDEVEITLIPPGPFVGCDEIGPGGDTNYRCAERRDHSGMHRFLFIGYPPVPSPRPVTKADRVYLLLQRARQLARQVHPEYPQVESLTHELCTALEEEYGRLALKQRDNAPMPVPERCGVVTKYGVPLTYCDELKPCPRHPA